MDNKNREMQDKIDRCYRSFGGRVCAGCQNGHLCQMAHDNMQTLRELQRTMRGIKRYDQDKH